MLLWELFEVIMKKLNYTAYNKLVAQAEEAKEQGKHKLATCIFYAIGSLPEEAPEEYSFAQLEEDLEKEMWKMATHSMKYRNVESVDAERIHDTIVHYAEKLAEALDEALGVDHSELGPLEPKVPGETK